MSNGNGNDRQITMVEPDKCIGCGWIPPIIDEETEPDLGSVWLIIPVPKSVVWLYICPICGVCMGNKNAIENVKKLKKLRESRIVQPPGPVKIT